MTKEKESICNACKNKENFPVCPTDDAFCMMGKNDIIVLKCGNYESKHS